MFGDKVGRFGSSYKWSDMGSPYKWPEINGFHWGYFTLLIGDIIITPFITISGPFVKLLAVLVTTSALDQMLQN